MNFNTYINSELFHKPHYLVVGDPVSHSKSPLMHNLALKHYGIEAEYAALHLAMADLTSFISLMNRDEFRGCNITIPYKNAFNDIVDQTDPLVEATGSMNTVVKEEGLLVGYTTDIAGFSIPLNKYRDLLKNEGAIIFGSGGVSKAVIHALLQLGMTGICVVSRNPESLDFKNERIIAADYNTWQHAGENAILLVNCTPLGMKGMDDKSPIVDQDKYLLMGKICYDLVYNPLNTPFLEQAVDSGGIGIGGLDMLIHQGSESFRLWTGKTFPIDLIKKELLNELS